MNKKDIATGVAGLILLITAGVGLTGWYNEHQQVEKLEMQMSELRLQEKKSAIVRSVSKQMEELAYQQRAISDEQREEALQQKKVADEMRLRSEVERQNAIVSQNKAIASEHQAQEALQLAESERLIAEQQRIKAEFSKRVADTLSYTALGRSLGSLSSIQLQLGNTEVGDLLAYASYYYTNKNRADVYYPAVFQALTTASESKHTWPRHKGSVTAMAYMSIDDDRMVTVSTYGEIFIHTKKGDELMTEALLNNSQYDFRDVFIDEHSTIYAVSRTGHLAIITKDGTLVQYLYNLDNPIAVNYLDENNLLIIGERGLAQFDKQRKMVVASRELEFKVTASTRYDYKPILFDDQGRQHLVNNINDFETSNVPFKGTITAFASSKNNHLRVYGLSDGTIYLMDEISGKVTKLEGHLSRISKLKLNGWRLFSASYDGSMKLWNTASEKIEPMTLISADSWIMNFAFDSKKQHAWMGDYQGNVIETILSVPMMVDIIRGKLKRDFTQDEWNYYIGKNIPYESFLSSSGKEVQP